MKLRQNNSVISIPFKPKYFMQHTDKNVLLDAPTGYGKTIAANELAISLLQSELELFMIGKYKVVIVAGDANIDTINSNKNTAQNDKI